MENPLLSQPAPVAEPVVTQPSDTVDAVRASVVAATEAMFARGVTTADLPTADDVAAKVVASTELVYRVFTNHPVTGAPGASKVVGHAEFVGMAPDSYYAAECLNRPEPGPHPGHRVHMADPETGNATGEIRSMSHEELLELDPATYHAVEPADRDRYIVIDAIEQRKAVYRVHDRHDLSIEALRGEKDLRFDTAEEADAEAARLNAATGVA